MKLKIISLNIWHGAFLAKAIEFLRAEDADIVLLQEVYGSQDQNLDGKYRSLDLIKTGLKYASVDFAQAYLEKINDALVPHGTAILSKFPISARSLTFMTERSLEYYVDTPEHWKILPAVLQHALIETNGTEVNVFNMHGPWDLDGDNYSDRRRKMSQAIITETTGKPNVVLAGDSNAKPTNQAMRNLEEHLKPVFQEELVTTFNMRHKDNPGYATAAVDLMYISPNIKVLSKGVPDVDISDHLPLVVTLQID